MLPSLDSRVQSDQISGGGCLISFATRGKDEQVKLLTTAEPAYPEIVRCASDRSMTEDKYYLPVVHRNEGRCGIWNRGLF